MLQTKNLEFGYSNSQYFKFPDLKCQEKETILVLGNSGVGKTTFLNLVGLLLTPSCGEIWIGDKNTSELSSKEKGEFRANKIGIIYQKPYFVNSLNVLENLLLANYLSDRKINHERAIQLANELGFEKLLQKKVQQLSGGEQQRVCIARALMNKPEVILADEPTSALDDENCQKVSDLLQNEANEVNASLVIVTHDQRLKAKFSNQIIL